jgi:hypothetical protein
LEGVFGVVDLFLFVDLTTGLIHGEFVLCYESVRRLAAKDRTSICWMDGGLWRLDGSTSEVGAGWVCWLLAVGAGLLFVGMVPFVFWVYQEVL